MQLRSKAWGLAAGVGIAATPQAVGLALALSQTAPALAAPAAASGGGADPAAASPPRGAAPPSPATIQRYLQVRGQTAGVFADHDRAILFLSGLTGSAQVWRVDAGGGWPDRLTFFPDRVQAAYPSPDGAWVVVAKDQGGDERTQLFLMRPDGTGMVPLTPHEPRAIHRFGAWSPDGGAFSFATNARSQGDFDVAVMDPAAGKARMVYRGKGANAAVAWAPDGRGLVVSHEVSNVSNSLHLVDLASGRARQLTPRDSASAYDPVAWPRGSRSLLLGTDERREFTNLAALDVDKGTLRFLEDRNEELESFALSKDGRHLALAYNHDGYSRLDLREVTGVGPLALEPLAGPAAPPGVISALSWSQDGGRLAFTLSSPTAPATVWVAGLADKSLMAVTHPTLAGVPKDSFVAPRLVSYASLGGRKIPAFLYLPKPENDGAPPAAIPFVVHVHGGPESQERPIFSPIYQYLLAHGYGVLAPNVRGSTGYGQAYTHLDDARLRGDAIADLAYANRYLRDEGLALPDRIAVMGGSYGGYMALSALTRQPELWAAGVDIVGISNFMTFLANTGPWRRALRVAEYGDPQKDRAFLTEFSPMNHADRIRAPLMVVQGANDPRVPRSEAEQMVKKVRGRGGAVEYLLFKDEGHGLAKLPNQVKAYGAIMKFFDRHLKGIGARPRASLPAAASPPRT